MFARVKKSWPDVQGAAGDGPTLHDRSLSRPVRPGLPGGVRPLGHSQPWLHHLLLRLLLVPRHLRSPPPLHRARHPQHLPLLRSPQS